MIKASDHLSQQYEMQPRQSLVAREKDSKQHRERTNRIGKEILEGQVKAEIMKLEEAEAMRTQKSKYMPRREGSSYSQCVRGINRSYAP